MARHAASQGPRSDGPSFHAVGPRASLWVCGCIVDARGCSSTEAAPAFPTNPTAAAECSSASTNGEATFRPMLSLELPRCANRLEPDEPSRSNSCTVDELATRAGGVLPHCVRAKNSCPMCALKRRPLSPLFCDFRLQRIKGVILSSNDVFRFKYCPYA